MVNRVLDDSVEPNIMKVKKIESVLADGGAHDTNSNFMYLERRRIKIRKKNSIISSRNNSLRNREVISLQIKSVEMEKEK